MSRGLIVLLAGASAGAIGWIIRGPASPPRSTEGVAPDTTFPAATIALGEKIFHGKVAGGLCFTCHGPAAKGTKGIAPNLTDATWLHGDGSYSFIVSTIESGVAKPKESPAPMPPKGGAVLTPDQVHAVAAYVYTLRGKK